MSLNVLTHTLSGIGSVAGEGGFQTPGVEDFWWPLIGEGAMAFTRPALVLLLSVGMIALVLRPAPPG